MLPNTQQYTITTFKHSFYDVKKQTIAQITQTEKKKTNQNTHTNKKTTKKYKTRTINYITHVKQTNKQKSIYKY